MITTNGMGYSVTDPDTPVGLGKKDLPTYWEISCELHVVSFSIEIRNEEFLAKAPCESDQEHHLLYTWGLDLSKHIHPFSVVLSF